MHEEMERAAGVESSPIRNHSPVPVTAVCAGERAATERARGRASGVDEQTANGESERGAGGDEERERRETDRPTEQRRNLRPKNFEQQRGKVYLISARSTKW